MLALGEDGKLSTSKFQFSLWTAAAVIAFIAVAIGHCVTCGDWAVPAIDDTLFIAMGFSIVTAATAKGIARAYISNGLRNVAPTSAAAPQAAGRTQRTWDWSDLFTTDDGTPDLAKTQMMLWTFVAIGIFIAQSTSVYSTAVLPPITVALLVLMGLGQGSYLANKAISADKASLRNLDKPVGGPSAVVTINGDSFGSVTGSVIFGNVTTVTQQWTDSAIAFLVPAIDVTGQPFGRGQTVYVGVLSPNGGQASNTLPFTFGGPWIARVDPPSGAPGTTFTITGSGFGAANLSPITFGDTTADCSSWDDTSITVRVPMSAASNPYPAGRTPLPVTITLGNVSATQNFIVSVPEESSSSVTSSNSGSSSPSSG